MGGGRKPRPPACCAGTWNAAPWPRGSKRQARSDGRLEKAKERARRAAAGRNGGQGSKCPRSARVARQATARSIADAQATRRTVATRPASQEALARRVASSHAAQAAQGISSGAGRRSGPRPRRSLRRMCAQFGAEFRPQDDRN